jgi:hypothetical protein
MTAMKPLRPAWLRRFGGRRIWRWTAAGLAVLLIPKCIACALAYFALAGVAGVEICGGPETTSRWLWFMPGLAGLFLLSVTISRHRFRPSRRVERAAATEPASRGLRWSPILVPHTAATVERRTASVARCTSMEARSDLNGLPAYKLAGVVLADATGDRAVGWSRGSSIESSRATAAGPSEGGEGTETVAGGRRGTRVTVTGFGRRSFIAPVPTSIAAPISPPTKTFPAIPAPPAPDTCDVTFTSSGS